MAAVTVPAAELERFHEAALALADEARRLVLPALARGLQVSAKADASLVTDLDRAVEARLRELIQGWFPDHGVIGEEEPPANAGSPLQWILDPIDGTEELVHGIPLFGVMLALHHGGRPLVGVIDHPALDLRVSAALGLGARRDGARLLLHDLPPETPDARLRLALSARLNFARHVDEGHLFEALTRRFPNHRIYRACYAHTAAVTGAVDVMVGMHYHPWDLAPTRVLVEEAGGRYAPVREFWGPDGHRLESAVFGRPAAVERVLSVFG